MYKPMVALAAAATITMAACAPDVPIPTPAGDLTSLSPAFPAGQTAPPSSLETSATNMAEPDPFAEARDRMVDFQIADRGVLSADVLAAMRAVPSTSSSRTTTSTRPTPTTPCPSATVRPSVSPISSP